MRPVTWRVRVTRTIEDWVVVSAFSPKEAEAKAVHLPGVVGVFGKSAIRGDLAEPQERPAGVDDGGAL
jgi:hypothetical protein